MTTLLAIESTVNTTDNTDNTTETPKIKVVGPLSRKVKAEHKHVDDSTQRKDDIAIATDAEQGKLDAYRSAENDVVNLIVATVDPKDALKKYYKVGKSTHALAERRRDSLAKGAWNGNKDFAKVCDDVETLVKMRVAVKDVRPSVYVRVYLWVDSVRAIVPNVDKLSYNTIANKLLPTLAFDPVELTGEIKKEWLTFVRVTCERQLSSSPMTMDEIDASYDETKAQIELDRKRNSKLSAEQQLENELKAANKKKLAERSASQSKVSESISNALIEGKADVNDILAVVRQSIASTNVEHERGIAIIDASKISLDDCKSLASVMCAEGKLAEMTFLRDRLDHMIRVATTALQAKNVA
jgi:hypothetical protein